MLKTNKLRFFKVLEKASKPLKTLKKVVKRHGDCNEKKTHQDKPVSASSFSDISLRICLAIRQAVL